MSNLGKPLKVITIPIREPKPVELPKPEPKEQPISVPNWPVRKKVPVAVPEEAERE